MKRYSLKQKENKSRSEEPSTLVPALAYDRRAWLAGPVGLAGLVGIPGSSGSGPADCFVGSYHLGSGVGFAAVGGGREIAT